MPQVPGSNKATGFLCRQPPLSSELSAKDCWATQLSKWSGQSFWLVGVRSYTQICVGICVSSPANVGQGKWLQTDKALCLCFFFFSFQLKYSWCKRAVSNLFGTRGRFCGRQFFHGLGWGVVDSSGGNVSNGSGGNVSNGEQQMKLRALLTPPLLTSCCVAWFRTGHRLVLVCSPGVGDPWCTILYKLQVYNIVTNNF